MSQVSRFGFFGLAFNDSREPSCEKLLSCQAWLGGVLCAHSCVCVVIKCIPLRGVELGAAKTATSEIAAVWTYHHLCSWWLAGSEETRLALRIPATTESTFGSRQTQLNLLSSKCLVWVGVVWKRLLAVMNPLKMITCFCSSSQLSSAF